MPFNIQVQAARQQPKQARTTHASSSPAQDDPCLQQPRLDGAKSDQLFFYRGHSSPQQGFTGVHRAFQAGKPRGPPCSFLTQNHNKNDAETQGHEGRSKGPTQSPPSSAPNKPKGSKMEPKDIAIQAKRYPSRATWSSKHLILGDSSLRGRRQRR